MTIEDTATARAEAPASTTAAHDADPTPTPTPTAVGTGSFALTPPATASSMAVTKRNGSREPVDLNKIVRAITRCSTRLTTASRQAGPPAQTVNPSSRRKQG